LDNKRNVSPVFNNNPQGSRLRGRPNNRWWNCVQTDISEFTIKNLEDDSKNRAAGKSIREEKVHSGP